MRHFQLPLIGLLVLILTIAPLSGCMPASEGGALKDKYETLQLEHNILKGKLEVAQADLAYVKAASETLRNDYDTLKTEYNTLKADHAVLEAASKKPQTEYDAMQASYDKLKDDYDTLKALYDDVSNELAEAKKSSLPASTPASDIEWVSVYKIVDFDKALIFRENGEAWILEKGVGCLSLDFYEGRRILIYSPGLFAGVGSKIILPDPDQLCKIWNAEFLGIKPTIIESHINGMFKGWDGNTIFELRNGQIWQQASYGYIYHYAFSPDVIIYSVPDGYKMMVDGVGTTVYVRLLN